MTTKRKSTTETEELVDMVYKIYERKRQLLELEYEIEKTRLMLELTQRKNQMILCGEKLINLVNTEKMIASLGNLSVGSDNEHKHEKQEEVGEKNLENKAEENQ